MYGLLSTLLYWPSDCVVKQGLHVSTMCTCHRGDARVTRASHIQGLCISTILIFFFRQFLSETGYAKHFPNPFALEDKKGGFFFLPLAFRVGLSKPILRSQL